MVSLAKISSSSAFPAISLGFTTLGEIFAYVTSPPPPPPLPNPPHHWGSHIPFSCMVHAGCLFVPGIHLSRTWMSGPFQSLRWNACVHRLELGIYSHSKDFWGNGVRTHIKSKGEKKTLSRKVRGGSNRWRCIMQDSEPNTIPTELFRPQTFHTQGGRLSYLKTRPLAEAIMDSKAKILSIL